MAMKPHPRLSIIAALARGNRAIGKDNRLPWRIPEDLKRFKDLTMGHPIVMGRKTFDSIGRPLPGRANIVVTSHPDILQEGVSAARSLDEALGIAAAHEGDEIFVIGGGQIYAQAIGRADRLYLTLVDDSPEADTFFPAYDTFHVIAETSGLSETGIHFVYQTLKR